ncbi:YjgN family protein [Parahaliea mediterranea]|uniref:DUF898 domain-containing protein n=1 Tax=Parahaliea mediterranea TaxID=651086 RepID=A0A939DID2_9GAMM|nr:YjgN family protein [Parahaliea mediterranea]MBN7798711.1 DUF898 domain-containing protein [Parahaliea mediterranea]
MGQRFDIYVTGTFEEGVEPRDAIYAFAQATGIDGRRAHRFLEGTPQIVRGDCSAAEAEELQAILRRLGIRCVRRDAGAQLLPGDSENPPGPAGAGDGAKTTRRPLPFGFNGGGYEYFRIWIVNLLLTIVTLGLYGPWAKVRNRQYFYGNTTLDNATFEYTADPLRMLVGRLIAMVLLFAYYAAGMFSPEAGALAAVLLMVAIPWAVNKSMAFHARNTVYRNLRFRFNGEYPEAFVVLILWPLAGALTLGLLMPLAIQRWQRYHINRHSYGDKSFQFSAGGGSFYKLCLWALAIALAGILAGAALGALIPAATLVGPLAGYALAMVYFTTTMHNLRFNHTTLASHAFSADFELRGFGWIMLSNFALIVLTLGLYLPWARVRIARYTAAHVIFHATGDLDRFAAISQPDTPAFGEEFSDVFDLDFGF